MKYLILRSILLSLFSFFQLQAQSWQIFEMSPLPEKVTNNAVVAGFPYDQPHVYSFGGIDSTKTQSGIHTRSYKYDVGRNSWKQIASLPDTLGKIASAASLVKDTIYVIGGYHVLDDDEEISSNKVHRYNTTQDTFMSDGANVPIPIDDHVQAVWRDSLIFVITGWSGDSNVSQVQIYNPSENNWQMGTSVPNNESYKSFGAAGLIIADTIFYYGGAGNGKNFPAQNVLRKGIINPQNPAEISWSDTTLDVQIKGYRMAATTVEKKIFWFGGSENTYNYDAKAYNGKGSVEPLNRILFFDTQDYNWGTSFVSSIPMDLRGVAELSKTIKILAGGMLNEQQVSNKTFRFEWTNR